MEMPAAGKNLGEEGGLYGDGKNDPPQAHQRAAREALKQIVPLNRQGKPSADGKIGFVCLGMSNTGGQLLHKRSERAWAHRSVRGALGINESTLGSD
jgi:hypothetical protein